jgi:hypothetical protein
MRDLFRTGPAPESGSSKPFNAAWFQEPEISGIAAAGCPAAGAATVTINVRSERKAH